MCVYTAIFVIKPVHSCLSMSQDVCLLLYICDSGSHIASVKTFLAESFPFERSQFNPFICLQVFSLPESRHEARCLLMALRGVVRRSAPEKIVFAEKLSVTPEGAISLKVSGGNWLHSLHADLTDLVPFPRNNYFHPHVTLGRVRDKECISQITEGEVPKGLELPEYFNSDSFVCLTKLSSPQNILFFCPLRK